VDYAGIDGDALATTFASGGSFEFPQWPQEATHVSKSHITDAFTVEELRNYGPYTQSSTSHNGRG
jgi:hypothetical protein